MKDEPREAQYAVDFQQFKELGPIKLGPMWSYTWRADPRHLLFTMSRYKFAAKMFHGLGSALEIGCGDGFGAGLVRQEVPVVHGTDFDPGFVEAAREQWAHKEGMEFFVADLLDGSLTPNRVYDGLFCLDVLEHIPVAQEDLFLRNCCRFLQTEGIAIFGTPSLESQVYASLGSKEGHVNCKSGYDFKATLARHFRHVFLFGMNDEVLHTGYSRMAHYNLVLCTDPRP